MNTQSNKAIIKRMIQKIESVDMEVNLPFYFCKRDPHLEEYHRVTKDDTSLFNRLVAAKVTFYDGLPWSYHNDLPFTDTIPADARIISYNEFADAVGQLAQVMENTLIDMEKFHSIPQIKEEA